MSQGWKIFVAKSLGPGLLFAGAAVGVSHLVQSTRAGAVFGLGLISVVILANVLKYPAFLFGPYYAAATGKSLLEGYRRRGRWTLILYAFLTLGTVFTVQAVVTLVTAGWVKEVLGIQASDLHVSVALMLICMTLLVAGGYHWLDLIMKFVVASLTVLTVVAAVLVIPKVDWSLGNLWPEQWDLKTTLFAAGLAGWMPSAIDISIWHSLWTLAKRKDTHHRATLGEAKLDFNIGYIGTALLAICFLLLGAGIAHGQSLPGGAQPFAHAVLSFYTETLGEWSQYVMGFCALMIMFSTTLAVTDGFPRALTCLYRRFHAEESESEYESHTTRQRPYWVALIIIVIGATIILSEFMHSFKDLVDVATTISFLTAPILALLNHLAVFSDDLRPEDQPSNRLRMFSQVCIIALSLFALLWFTLRFL